MKNTTIFFLKQKSIQMMTQLGVLDMPAVPERCSQMSTQGQGPAASRKGLPSSHLWPLSISK